MSQGVPFLVTKAIAVMHGPAETLRRAARNGPGGKQAHDQLADQIEALQSVEVDMGRSIPGPAPASLRIGAWNMERCKHVEASGALLTRTGADVLLLSEMDHGMARSKNRHTTRELAQLLDLSHVFATEFVELGLGDDREKLWHAGETNLEGLHGNALVARWPLTGVTRIALDDGAAWFAEESYLDQRRIGGRCAVHAELETMHGALSLISLHLESHSDPTDRERQIVRLLEALDQLCPEGPAIIGGDFNTAALPRGVDPEDVNAEWFIHANRLEPLFAQLEQRGFGWRKANAPAPTCRTLPDGRPKPPFGRIDWFFTRGLSLSSPTVWPATDEAGSAISDHELITIDVSILAGAQ